MKNLLAEFTKIRRLIHENPELGFKEFKTAALVASELKKYGFSVYEGIAKTGVVGVLKKGNSKKSIALRADMDALDMCESSNLSYASKNGCMHACGHDGHTASLLMSAKYLSTKDFNGTLNVIFQPAEECCDDEGLSGAMRMVKEGIFDKFPSDFIFAYHNMPKSKVNGSEKIFFMKKGALMAGVSAYEIIFEGIGGHASAPFVCKDPIVGLNSFITALYSFKSLEVKDAVINVTSVHSGTAFNIIPDTASIKVNVRSLDNAELDFIDKRINEIAKNVAQIFNLKMSIHKAESLKATINNDEAWEFASKVAINVFGEENCEFNHSHSMGAEDFSEFLGQIKGTYAFINNGDSKNSHNSEYDFNDEIMINACKYFSGLVLEYLK